MTEASNLDTGRKLLSRNQKARKRRKEVDEFKLVILGQPQKPVVLSVPCFQFKHVSLKLRKISKVGDVDYRFEEMK